MKVTTALTGSAVLLLSPQHGIVDAWSDSPSPQQKPTKARAQAVPTKSKWLQDRREFGMLTAMTLLSWQAKPEASSAAASKVRAAVSNS